MNDPAKGWGGLCLAALLAGPGLQAAEPLVWGVQAGLRMPLQSDLRVTTGSGLDPSLGVHGDWNFREGQTLRVRLDLGAFSSADQVQPGPPYQQAIHTRVKDTALGAEYLYRPALLGGAWTVGGGAYLIRWKVDSTEQLVLPAGAIQASSASSWTREGLGGLVAYRWNRHLDTEVRAIFSHYGYENQPARLASFNVLWTF